MARTSLARNDQLLDRAMLWRVLLMASVATLPEIAVTLSALRLRALDMAIGNLLGSNLCNMAILAIDDIFMFVACCLRLPSR
jgi:Ca2+/Na+ antiporter